MKICKKTIYVIALLLFICVFLGGCSFFQDEPLQGLYVGETRVDTSRGSELKIAETAWGRFNIEIKKDGICTLYYDDKAYEGSWAYSLEEIYINIPRLAKPDMHGTVKNGVMYLKKYPDEEDDIILFLEGKKIKDNDIPKIYKPSHVEQAYNHAINIDINDCELKGNGRYVYYTVNYDRVMFLEKSYIKSLNMISSNAFYDLYAASLEHVFDADYEFLSDDYFKNLGVYHKPETKEEAIELVNKVLPYIHSDAEVADIVKAFESLEGTEGTFDYDAGKYNFTISDLQKASDDLHITEEMMGYILAYIDGVFNDITFTEDSVTVVIN